MLTIHPIAALSDNYIWTIVKDNQAIVIDPSESTPVLDFLADGGLTLHAILITHHHHDHIGGVGELLNHFPKTPIYCHSKHIMHDNVKAIDDEHFLALLNEEFIVLNTFGHTDTHLSYGFTNNGKAHLFCGDTLFKAGCGRVFTGTIDDLYQSFLLLGDLDNYFNVLDKHIYFYPAHEYTLANLAFAHALEPNNAVINDTIANDTKLRDYHLPTLPTTLSLERQINPFLRATKATASNSNASNDLDSLDNLASAIPSELLNNAKKYGYTGSDDDNLSLFAFLREFKNTF